MGLSLASIPPSLFLSFTTPSVPSKQHSSKMGLPVFNDQFPEDSPKYDNKITPPTGKTSILALPNELLHPILADVQAVTSTTDFRYTILMCKRFYDVGLPLYHAELSFSSRNYDYRWLLSDTLGDRSSGLPEPRTSTNKCFLT